MRLTAVVTIHNSGKTATTFRPFFVMTLLHSEFANKPYVMATEQKVTSGQNPFSLTSGGFSIAIPSAEAEGKTVVAKPFLEEASAAPYITIPPGEAKEVTLVVIGLALGLAAALAAVRLLSTYLYGVSATDRMTFGAIVALLAGVALFACYVPARRGLRVDPVQALRHHYLYPEDLPRGPPRPPRPAIAQVTFAGGFLALMTPPR